MNQHKEVMIVKEAEQLSPEVVSDLRASFDPLFQSAQEWKKKAEGLVVKDASETDKMKKAREARLELKRIRVDAKKVHTKLKEESLLRGRAIDGMFNIIKFLVKPIEDHLEAQEKFIENQEQERLDRLNEARIERLSKYVEDVSIYPLRDMSDESFEVLFLQSKKVYEAQIAEEKRLEKERTEREEAEKKEQERIRLENERLKKEAMEREKKLKLERAVRAEELRAEREAREKAEAQLRAKREAEEKAKAEAEAATKRQKAEEERLAREAQIAPDREKLKRLVFDLRTFEYPEMTSEEGKEIVDHVKSLVQMACEYIREANES